MRLRDSGVDCEVVGANEHIFPNIPLPNKDLCTVGGGASILIFDTESRSLKRYSGLNDARSPFRQAIPI
jgi:hypothetical protein